MKRFLCALLAACAVLLTACTEKLYDAKLDDDKLTIEKNGVTYIAAGVNYEAVALGDAYASIDGTYKATLYCVPGTEPEYWLTEDTEDGTGTLYHNSLLSLPSLGDMNAKTLDICRAGDVAISLVTIDDAEIISEVIEKATGGSENCMWPRPDETDRFQLRFSSPDYPAFQYILQFAVCPDGNYIYDREAKFCADAGDLLLDLVKSVS